MFRRLTIAGGLLAAALTPSLARADAGAIMTKLQQTPATLWDLSMARLEAALATGAGGKGLMTFVGLNDDKIELNIDETDGPSTKAECKRLADRVRVADGIDLKTGYPDDPASYFASLFNYPQIDQFKVDESYAETVDGMFEVLATVGVSGDGKATICKGPLLSTELTYTNE